MDSCIEGDPHSLGDDGTNYFWTCNVSGGGNNVSCSSPMVIDGACGGDAKEHVWTGNPTTLNDLCDEGTPDPLSVTLGAGGGLSISWTCEGIGGGAPGDCIATRGMPPATCGAENNKIYPHGSSGWDTLDFCTHGTSDPPSPPFPGPGSATSWTCTIGTDVASCSASQAMPVCGELDYTPPLDGCNFGHTECLNTGYTCNSDCSCSAPTCTPSFTALGGGDHCGQDWIISSNTAIAGVHTNVGNFVIDSGKTATVKKRSGSNYGFVKIHAVDIDIKGTLDAIGAGYGGGGGGGGGAGANGGAAGSGGAGTIGGGNGLDGGITSSSGGVGGKGGMGGGLFPGSGGNGGSTTSTRCAIGGSGNTGGAGKYCSSTTSSCSSTTKTIDIGSGGGGAGGGAGGNNYCGHNNFPGGGGGGGGSGGSGGGSIYLSATNLLQISGNIYAKGTKAGNGGAGLNGNRDAGRYTGGGNGGNGGSAGSSGTSSGGPGGDGDAGSNGGSGGSGGAGSGGGLLLDSPTIIFSGLIDLRDGSNTVTYGGMLKIFGDSSPENTGTLRVGKVYIN
jgi:hypothetical protein